MFSIRVIMALFLCLTLATFHVGEGAQNKGEPNSESKKPNQHDKPKHCPNLAKLSYGANGFSCCGPIDKTSGVCEKSEKGGKDSKGGGVEYDNNSMGGKGAEEDEDMTGTVKEQSRAICNTIRDEATLQKAREAASSDQITDPVDMELADYVNYCCSAPKNYNMNCSPPGSGASKFDSWMFLTAFGVLFTIS